MATLKIVLEDMDRAITSEIQELVFDIHGKLVQLTPVDTGWASNNWIPSVGTPIKIEAFGSEVATGLLEIAKWNAKNPAYITNNVKYIQVLNAGHSRQAPPGFIEAIIQESVNEFKRRKIK